MNSILMWLIAFSAVLAGLDKIFGNKLGLGQHFDKGFELIGPMISGMTGILCLTPLISRLLQFSIAPLFQKIGLDPAILAGILAIDMGGYPLAVELAGAPAIGQFAGIMITSTFGCSFIFTIPVGYSMLKENQRPAFIQGIMYGLITLPVTVILGGLAFGIGIGQTFQQSLPILLASLLLALGMKTKPQMMARIFAVFAKIIQALSIFGILIGLTEYLTGHTLIPGLLTLREALLNAALCGILLIGSLPLAEILSRILHKPLRVLGSRIGLTDKGLTGMLLSLVSVPAGLGLMHEMDNRDVMINAAFLVSAASVFGAHLGVCAANAPELTAAFIFTRLIGAFLTTLFTAFISKKSRSGNIA